MNQRAQAERSKQWMFEALHKILQKKPFQDISITEIAEKAGVSRLTFYRHFDDKRHLLHAYTDQSNDAFVTKILRLDEKDPCFILKNSFDHFEKNLDYIRLMFQNSLFYELYERNIQSVFDTFFPNLTTYAQKKFAIGGSYSVVREWLYAGNKITKEDALSTVMEYVVGREKAKEYIERSLMRDHSAGRDIRHFSYSEAVNFQHNW
ncbi:MAG: TetR/AcrR family transcriptional regulator [Synergistaceae bacterium]|nr:TetR/AcrR family transcriptional regulator [Synergistaceae bacterium]